MKAIAVKPGTPDSVHLAELEKPAVSDIPNGRGVLVEVLQVGVDGTDKEINNAEYGDAPPGYEFLVIGHESFGRVVEVGPNVTELKAGDYVTATVRRPGDSIYDLIGHYDMTTDDTYYERGINLRHGYLTEFYVDDPEYIVKVPDGLAHIGVLSEPMSIVEKALEQAYEIQRRLRVWRPKRAAIFGAGAIGQLGALACHLRGLETVCIARTPAPNVKATQVEQLGVPYENTTESSLAEICEKHGPFDMVLEASGNAGVAFGCMEILAKNGVLILSSITGGSNEVTIPGDKVNLDFVLNNKVMFGTVNAHRGYFESAMRTFALAEAQFPGWLAQMLTHPVDGLDNYRELMDKLVGERTALKVFMNVKK